ncbi:hypothetical protein [Rhizobium sp. Rhizsp82]|uniref:hypothetical protein n=1 Tax=Rhizobium sp. Rhizsp82 TaxID=3243057 RepID=UPI0039B45FBD
MILDNKRVQISLSEAPDHRKLSIPTREFDRAMLTICMALVRAGAKVVYGGDLRPNGYTFRIFRHLAQSYASRGDVPFIHVIYMPSLLLMEFDVLSNALEERQGTCDTFACLDRKMVPVYLDGKSISFGEGSNSQRFAERAQFFDWQEELRQRARDDEMSIARATTADFVNACITIGGKMGVLANKSDLYKGKLPGIIEEAIYVMKEGKPVVPLGAYGGATRDLAIEWGLMDAAERVPRGEQDPTYQRGLDEAAELKGAIPSELLGKLKSLAHNDRAEDIAREAVDVIDQWTKVH